MTASPVEQRWVVVRTSLTRSRACQVAGPGRVTRYTLGVPHWGDKVVCKQGLWLGPCTCVQQAVRMFCSLVGHVTADLIPWG